MSDLGENNNHGGALDGDQEMIDVQRVTKTKRMANRLLAKHAYNSLSQNNDQELFELKLPSSIRIQPVEFDAKEYQIEDPIVFTNDAGVLTERDCAVDNIIRFKPSDKSSDTSSLGLEIKNKVKYCLHFIDLLSMKVMQRSCSGPTAPTAWRSAMNCST